MPVFPRAVVAAPLDLPAREAATKFVGPVTFAAVTGRSALTDADLWRHDQHVPHVQLGEKADLLIIAPATANTIAKLAHGQADNLLSVTALAARSPIILVPAMDGGMWSNAATQANIATLRERGFHIVGEYSGLPAAPSLADVRPIARAVIDGYTSGEFDVVYLVYADFVNTLVQRPAVKRLLPLKTTEVESQAMSEHIIVAPTEQVATDYIYEPSPRAILDVIVPRFTELQIYQAVLESLASEHSARMVAMKNATDNANQFIKDLTLEYNKMRQAGITTELLEIATAQMALAG